MKSSHALLQYPMLPPVSNQGKWKEKGWPCHDLWRKATRIGSKEDYNVATCLFGGDIIQNKNTAVQPYPSADHNSKHDIGIFSPSLPPSTYIPAVMLLTKCKSSYLRLYLIFPCCSALARALYAYSAYLLPDS